MSSSAALNIVLDDAPIPDPKAQRRTSALSKVIGQINRLDQVERDVIALLPHLTFEEVIETRNSAKLLIATGWKIEIACDAEIWDRAEASIAKSGIKDVDGKGVKALVNKRAQEIGCGASTIYANRQLYRRFAPVLSTQSTLDEKGFYQAALKTDDPEAKIEEWAKRKLEDPFFSVGDAWREVKPKSEGLAEDETKVLQTKEAQKFLAGLHKVLLKKMEKVPTNAAFLRNMVEKMDGMVLWQSERTVEGDCRLILQAIDETGGLTDDQLFTWLTERCYCMSDPQLDKRLAFMVETKQISTTDAGPDGKLDESRGKPQTWYVPYFVKHKAPPKCKRCGEWHREESDCLELPVD